MLACAYVHELTYLVHRSTHTWVQVYAYVHKFTHLEKSSSGDPIQTPMRLKSPQCLFQFPNFHRAPHRRLLIPLACIHARLDRGVFICLSVCVGVWRGFIGFIPDKPLQ